MELRKRRPADPFGTAARVAPGMQESKGNWRQRVERKSRKLRAKWRERLRPIVIKNRGHCPICDRGTTFVARDAWLRDHYLCTRCKSIPRERALMTVLQDLFPDWRSLIIHESSPGKRGVSRRLAEECARYIPTHFFPGVPLGSMLGEWRCENLEQLTFEDASIDLHITQDVLEHVWHPHRAFAEIARTLKPGGAHLFTVPIENRNGPTTPRVSIDAVGTLTHLKPPVYHGNPIDAKGSLVTMDWGFDIQDHIKAASGCETEIIVIDDLSRGIRGEYLEVLVSRKPM